MALEAKKRAPRMSPADRYAQLLPIAEELFVTHGYPGVSMEDIARAAGVTRPVVYDHFGSKEGAFLACVKSARAAFEAGLRESMGTKATLREQIRAGAEFHFQTLERDPRGWQLLFSSNAVLPEPFGQRLAQLRLDTIEQIRLIFEAGAPDAPRDRLEACAHAISGLGERLGLWWITRPDISRATMVEHYLEVAWTGLNPYVKS